jgi:probable phosphoglycerate mutase
MRQRWPSRLWVVRHGESSGNVARDAAMRDGLTHIGIAERDVDVPLSELGKRQSLAIGRWFASLPADQRPEVVIASPYERARETASIIQSAYLGGQDQPRVILDERLREKEFGILDRLTRSGIEKLHPEQAEFRQILGKFYHRPPAGESWCDVILRLRSALDTISIHHADKRVLIVAHQVVVLCMRYLIEEMTEQEILAIDAEGDVANCSVTEYALDGSANGEALVLQRYNFVAPIEDTGTPVTAQPDANVASR